MSRRDDARSLLGGRHRLARVALGLGVVAGLLTVGFYLLLRPNPSNTFDVFYAAAQHARSGQVVYDTEFGLYVYTPVSLLFFYPYLLVDFPTALLVHRVVSLLTALGCGVLVARFLAVRARPALTRLDRVLVVAFFSLSLYPVTVTVLAGPEILLGAALTVGFLALEADEGDWTGLLWAGAALVKVFPAMWGAYLLRQRAWRATAVALVTGTVATLVGVAVFGLDAYVRYVESTTTNRVRVASFAGGNSPDNEAVTLVRPLSQAFPTVDPHVWPPVIFVVVLVVGVAALLRVDADELTGRATQLLTVVVGVTFVMPTSQDLDMVLLYGPLVVLLYLEEDVDVRALYAVGTVVYLYNVGREELRAVAGVFGAGVGETVMVVGEPVLSFASMPLYGLVVIFAGCLLRARREADTGDASRPGAAADDESPG